MTGAVIGWALFTAILLFGLRQLLRREYDRGYHRGQCDAAVKIIREAERFDVVETAEDITREAAG